MKKSFFITIIFLSLIIILYFSSPGLPAAELIFVDPDVDTYHKVISVKRGDNFTIRLKGSGWYLNRYDGKNLSFKLRTVHTEYTDFSIHPVGDKPAYLFFSYLDKDMYIRVNIDHPGKSESGELPKDEKSSTESNFINKDEIKKETSPEREIPVEEDMYYVTEDKEIVKIPSVNEEIKYRRGVEAFNSDELEKAQDHVLEYLSSCVSCTYKDEAHFMASEIYIKQENEEKAMIFLDELIAFGTQEYKIKAARRKADLYYNSGNLEDALKSYNILLLYDNNNIEVLKNTGDIYYQLKDYENALTNYELGMGNGLDVDKVYFRTALMYDSSGKLKDLEKAYRYYRLILEMFPDSEHYPEVKQRVQFMEEHFFNYE